MELHFRPAEPRDVDQAPSLIYSAGVEGFDYVFEQDGKTALDFLRYAFLEGSGFFGHKNHVVVIADGRVVGIGAFYSGREYDALGRGTGKQLLRFYGVRNCLPIMKRSFHAQRITPQPGKDMEYVADLGVAEDMRSKGIGAALLTRQMEAAQSKKRRIYALDVSENNPRAQELYESLGFYVTGKNRFRGSRESYHVPDTWRMELPL